jgi:protocatechuate 3,4-dioxygenase alpha subunit
MKLIQTPSQTVGPYFAYGLTSEQYGYDFRSLFGPVLAEPQATGEHIRLSGRVFDGDGVPVPDAMLEIRQADAEGRFVASRAEAVASGFRGFGRCGTGTHPSLHYWFDTVKPGAAAPGEAPCIDLIVTMRGMLLHAFTRVYFDDEQEANARDPVLGAVPAERRATLIARREAQPGGVSYRFDIRMQGAKETVFFDL